MREQLWVIQERIECVAMSDLAYIAGFLDGEGTFSIYKKKKWKTQLGYYQALLRASNTDKATMQWLQAVLGGRLQFIKRRKKKHKDMYRLTLYARTLRTLLPRLLPYLRQKKQHAEIILQFLKTKHYGYGKPIPFNVKHQRKGLAERIKVMNRR